MSSPVQVQIIQISATKIGASPDPVKIDRDNQKLQWSIAVPGFSWPPAGGIVPKKKNLPAGFTAWPGDTPKKNGAFYEADANNVLPHGSSSQKYKYNIFLVDSSGKEFILSTTEDYDDFVKKHGADRVLKVDPDIENDPLP